MKKSERRLLFIQGYGRKVSCCTEHLQCTGGKVPVDDGGTSGMTYRELPAVSIPFSNISGLVVSAHASCSSQVIQKVADMGLPVTLLNEHSEPTALCLPMRKNGFEILSRQMRVTTTPETQLELGHWIARRKLEGCRQVVENWATHRHDEAIDTAKKVLRRALRELVHAEDLDSIRGIEGSTAKCYWAAFAALTGQDYFTNRTRRPPKSPADVLLSLGYTILTHELAACALCKGLDLRAPALHTDPLHYASLPWDLVELLRARVVDRLVLSGIHRQQFPLDYFSYADDGACLADFTVKRTFLKMLFECTSDGDELYRPVLEKAVDDYIEQVNHLYDEHFLTQSDDFDGNSPF